MKIGSALLVGSALAAGVGCSWSHQFALEELDRVKLGETTVEQAERILHVPEHRYLGGYYSSEQSVVPPSPLPWLTWPLFWGRHRKSYELQLYADGRGVVTHGTLEIGEQSATTILMLFGPNDFTARFSDGELEILRRLQSQGYEIRIGVRPILCFGGILGWETEPLDDYLGLGD